MDLFREVFLLGLMPKAIFYQEDQNTSCY